MPSSRVGAIAPQPVRVSPAEEGRDLDRDSHARRPPLPDRKDPYISGWTPACSSRGPPTTPTGLALAALAALAALPAAASSVHG